MSLRSDIHAAYDELGPAPSFLADRILNACASETRQPRRVKRWTLRVRAPLTLVAVLLVIAVVVGALIGGRVVGDWNKFINPTVPGEHSLFERQLHDLESRTTRFSRIPAQATCQGGPFDPATGWWGAGPAYLSSNITQGMGGTTVSQWGLYVTFNAMMDPSLTGPVLFRAENLRSGRAVLFVGNYGVGAVAGSDVVNGANADQYAELALDAGRPPKLEIAGHYEWTFQAGIFLTAADRSLIGAPAGAGTTFCVGWQVDGASFTEAFVVSV